MITDRTLLAYEQFCEEYYDNFDVLSRSSGSSEFLTPGYVGVSTSHVPYNRLRNLVEASRRKEWGDTYKFMGDNPNIRYKDLPYQDLRDSFIYKLSNKRLDKLRMKRDPEYRDKRVAEITARKEKNRNFYQE